MSRKTSTAALVDSYQGFLRDRRRVPRHPAGASNCGTERSNDSQMRDFQEASMNSESRKNERHPERRMVTKISRITFSLLLWTLGAASMDFVSAQTSDHRSVQNLAVDRMKVEDLQRWVNAGHDLWCRDPRLVATEALRRVSSQFSEIEPASLPMEVERSYKTTAIYTFHSVDGRATYRITMRRYRWLLPVAGSYQHMIWVPERIEVLMANTLD
jgi:hypothetical protein